MTRPLAPHGFLFIEAAKLFPAVSRDFLGQIEIDSAAPISAVAIRSTTNSRGDSIFTGLPLTDLTRDAADGIVLPQVVIGGGFSMKLLFVNRDTLTPVSGVVTFLQPDGNPIGTPKLEGSSNYSLYAGGIAQLFPGNTAFVNSAYCGTRSRTCRPPK